MVNEVVRILEIADRAKRPSSGDHSVERREPRTGGFRSPGLQSCPRPASLGHGGQVLSSGSTVLVSERRVFHSMMSSLLITPLKGLVGLPWGSELQGSLSRLGIVTWCLLSAAPSRIRARGRGRGGGSLIGADLLRFHICDC